MREIEFRGLGYNNKWLYGHYSDETDGHSNFPCIIPFKNTESLSCWIVDKNTVGQYTGLKDKNGVKIYEGDIVKSNKSKYTRFNKQGVYEVYFNEFLCHYALVDSSVEWNNKNGAYDNYSLTGAKTKDFEVIGNIHEENEDNDN